MEVIFGKKKILNADCCPLKEQLLALISEKTGLAVNDFYLICNGRRVSIEDNLSNKVYITLRISGGKGGFGSMLRAIGAQIEKTTNREACRDLSGRRLRDINEEQRLKKWVAEQADREKEAKERKKKKLEKLLEQPKHTFEDQEYDNERSSLPEKVEDAVLKGLEASCSTKRKSNDTKNKVLKKKPKLWVDSELDEDISSSESDNEDVDSKSPTGSQGTNSLESLSQATKIESDDISEGSNNSKSLVSSQNMDSQIVTEKSNEEILEENNLSNVSKSG